MPAMVVRTGGSVTDVGSQGLLFSNKAATSARVRVTGMELRDAGSYTGVEGRPCMPPHCPAGDAPIKGKFPGDPKAEYPPGARASAVGIFYRDGYSHEAQGGIEIQGLRVVESRGARPWLQAMGKTHDYCWYLGCILPKCQQ